MLPRRGNKQPWYCDCCGAHGEVPLTPGGTSMDTVTNLIRGAHSELAPKCAKNNSGGRLLAGIKPVNWLPWRD